MLVLDKLTTDAAYYNFTDLPATNFTLCRNLLCYSVAQKAVVEMSQFALKKDVAQHELQWQN